MELGAFVLIPEHAHIPGGAASAAVGSAGNGHGVGFWPVVGKSLIDEWTERVRRIGARVLSIASGSKEAGRQVARNLATNGVEQILLIPLKSYAEIDLGEFVHFHRHAGAASTEAFDGEGALGIEIVNRASLVAESHSDTAAASGAAKYRFSGYAKRLGSPKTYRDLVTDALSGRCALAPQGSQVEQNIWIGEETQIAPSVRFVGPCFVGEGTVLHDFVTIGPFSSVENECRVDSGTAVEESSVLPNSRLAAGLSIRRSIIDGPRLEHLDSGTIVDLHTSALGGRFYPKRKTQNQQGCGAQARSLNRFSFTPPAYSIPGIAETRAKHA